MRLGFIALLLLSAIEPRAAGQTFDTTGNGMLQGSYYFREVVWLVGDSTGALSRAIAVYGSLNFDGNGKYTLSNSMVMDSDVGAPQNYPTASGTYSISSSGYGFISSPLASSVVVYGLVSNGIFIGSSTEGGFNDMFIAAQLSSPNPTNSSFRGTYSMMDIDFPSGSPLGTRDSQFQLNPDGNGNIGAFRATGYISGLGSSVVTQNIPSVRFFFSNGAANVNFGGTLTAGNLLAGTKYLYFSADGNFVFGGSPTAWDMIIGVRGASSTPNFNGLYYEAGLFQDESHLGSGFADLNSYYGAFKANSGVILAQQRLFSGLSGNPIDFTYSDSYSLKSDGTYDNSAYHYVFGANGAIRIGVGTDPTIGIDVAIQAPSFTPTGVFIDPTGVVNEASSALFTSGVAPGEMISIYGSNLASTTLVNGSFPLQLGGVQVMVNNRPAPIYLVSPNRITVVVPFATAEVVAAIQVINNGVASNTVTSFVNLTAAGVFTTPTGGLGYAAALHPDFTLVTPANPAQVGETISLFVTGLGAVTPAVSDGAPGPVSPLSSTTNTISVYIGGQKAVTSFVGLAPQLVGLYQINVQIPSGVSGNATLDVAGPDFYSSQAYIPVGSPVTPTATGARLAAHQAVPRRDGERRTARARQMESK